MTPIGNILNTINIILKDSVTEDHVKCLKRSVNYASSIYFVNLWFAYCSNSPDVIQEVRDWVNKVGRLPVLADVLAVGAAGVGRAVRALQPEHAQLPRREHQQEVVEDQLHGVRRLRGVRQVQPRTHVFDLLENWTKYMFLEMQSLKRHT